MKIVAPSHEILWKTGGQDILRSIELAGRTCYKSTKNISNDSAKPFVEKILHSGHHSVIEHINITVKFVCDRGVSHEIVRHRLASYSQESTRYANYSADRFGREITVIKPLFWAEDSPQYSVWLASMQDAEKAYMTLVDLGCHPEQARSVLPNSLKTEIVMTCNLREWRHVLELRCAPAAHPQMRQTMLPLLRDFSKEIPVLFDDIYTQYSAEIL